MSLNLKFVSRYRKSYKLACLTLGIFRLWGKSFGRVIFYFECEWHFWGPSSGGARGYNPCSPPPSLLNPCLAVTVKNVADSWAAISGMSKEIGRRYYYIPSDIENMKSFSFLIPKTFVCGHFARSIWPEHIFKNFNKFNRTVS